MAYSIDKDVPLPQPAYMDKISPIQGAVEQLGVGHSFFMPTDNPKSSLALAHKCALRAHVKVTARRVFEDGVHGLRVWRVE